MNIHTVAENLRNTIAGKEKYQEELAIAAQTAEFPETTAIDAMVMMLDVNLEELKRILQDVEQCCQQHTEMGWQINPERMGQ
jgi:hypothetical protein